MWRLVVSQVLRRRGRSLAVVAAIVVAAVSFSLLSASVATSRLEVKGIVEANFRTAYDILVRPSGSQTALERSDQLVRENYLSGIFGGISMAQYNKIASLEGVQVAAPVAVVGYVLPSVFFKDDITDLLTDQPGQLYRLTKMWTSDRGLSTYREANQYVYVTRDNQVHVCRVYSRHRPTAESAFDLKALTPLTCFATNNQPNRIGGGTQFPYPLLLAAIDPEQEAALVGLDDAITNGRYLTGADAPEKIRSRPNTPVINRRIPVIMADQPLVDERVEMRWTRLDIQDSAAVPRRLTSDNARRWLDGLSGTTVRSRTRQAKPVYRTLVKRYSRPANPVKTNYWSTGQVEYQRRVDGHLSPIRVPDAPPETWAEPLYEQKYYAPPANSDVGFRTLQAHTSYNSVSTANILAAPLLHSVGEFDPSMIEGFSPLSRVPLTTYFAPSAAPGDARSRSLLGGRSLAPNSNLAGYLQQPPMMLTTLKSLPRLTSRYSFSGVTAKNKKQPISVIRVRVAGVSGTDALSRERVRLVAEQIRRQTGLDVDITIGSSPTPQLIDLPAGNAGRSELTLRESWVRKGVTVALLDAIDTKSVALFALVLLVCLLFLLNATIAAVRTRRSELGVLACLGWPRRRIFALLLLELVATGVVAGLVGTAVAAVLVWALGLQISWWQLVAITPVATVLATAAGVWPAWRACHARPIEAIGPLVRAPRKAGRVGSVTRLALVGIARAPGRTVLGAASLFIGAAALAVLIAIQAQFQGGVAGTLLGDVVAIQVRGVDYLAAALTIALGAFAVADIAYLNIAERTPEISTFRASGWTEQHVRRLFGTEAALTAVVGAVLGAATGVAIVAWLFPIAWTTALGAAAIAAALGSTTAIGALTIPLARLSKIAPAAALTE